MLRLDDIKTRIEERVEGLKLSNAGEFTRVIQSGSLPQWRLGGFLLPGTLLGSGAQALTGAFVQNFSETVSVVLVTRVQGDPTGEKAVDELTPLIRSVVTAVCGWAPADDVPGVFVLVKGELVGSLEDALIYQLDFALSDQLRILS